MFSIVVHTSGMQHNIASRMLQEILSLVGSIYCAPSLSKHVSQLHVYCYLLHAPVNRPCTNGFIDIISDDNRQFLLVGAVLKNGN